MTTKAQERSALQKIAEILSTLDADGYVRTAFDGVLEIAETNIENDWACSLKEQVESARVDYGRVCEVNSNLSEKIRHLETKIAVLNQAVEDERNIRKGIKETLDMEYDESQKLQETLQETQLDLDGANREIVELKARLYDYMTEKKEG